MYRCSVSQVRTAEDCLRKWGFDKLDRVPRVPHPSAALGSAVHAQLERYLRDGVPLDLTTEAGQIAMAGAHLWPKAPYLIEHRLDFELDGIPFVGFVDILSPRIVHDHKTAGDLRYALTREELQRDTQATAYAHVTGADTLHWIYYRTKKAYKAIDVTANVDKMALDDRVGATAQTARLLRSFAETPGLKALDLPPNPAACDRYGGCPHKAAGRCAGDFSDSERMRAFMSTASMLDQLSQRVNPPALPVEAPPVAAPAVDPPLLADGTRNLPDGWFWFRGAEGWATAPEAMRAAIDPDGSKCWPRPAPAPNSIEALAAEAAPMPHPEETAQTFAERIGAAFTTLAGIQAIPTQPASPELDAAIAADAESAREQIDMALLTASNAQLDTLTAILGSPPPKAKRGRTRKEAPDLDPRVRVIHDPEAATFAEQLEQVAAEVEAKIESGEIPDPCPPVFSDPRFVAKPFTSCAEKRAVVDPLRDAIVARALALVPNASAAELVDLMAIVGGFDS